MKIVCTQSVFDAHDIFSTLGDVSIVADNALCKNDLTTADALITRSQNKIDANLLAGTAIKFVGTATSGVDHVDIDYLKQNNIIFADAKGCNANAVAEYVLACLPATPFTIGIVGYGCVGKRLHQLLLPLKCEVLINDSPLYDAGALPEHQDLTMLCQQADVISLHIPLNKEKKYSTYQLINAEFFAQCKKQPLLINAARGDVMDYPAMLHALTQKQIANVILDVWPNEPTPDKRYIDKALIATPHIAGHSIEAKWQGTYQIYQALCDYLQIQAETKKLHYQETHAFSLTEITRKMQAAEDFNQLRKQYGNRHEQHSAI